MRRPPKQEQQLRLPFAPGARRCPKCRGELVYVKRGEFWCRSCQQTTRERAELEQLERRCPCGGELVGAVNDRRGLCDPCILKKTNEGHKWHEDPEEAREHLREWLRRRRAERPPMTEDQMSALTVRRELMRDLGREHQQCNPLACNGCPNCLPSHAGQQRKDRAK